MIREEDLFEGFTIGEWEVLPAKGLVRRGDEEEHLEPKVFAVLIALARRNGNLMTKDELIDEVWDGRVFDDQPIQRAITLLRKHLHDTKPFEYVGTLRQRGYRLVKPVQLHKPADSLPTKALIKGPARQKALALQVAIIVSIAAATGITWVFLSDNDPLDEFDNLPGYRLVLEYRDAELGDVDGHIFTLTPMEAVQLIEGGDRGIFSLTSGKGEIRGPIMRAQFEGHPTMYFDPPDSDYAQVIFVLPYEPEDVKRLVENGGPQESAKIVTEGLKLQIDSGVTLIERHDGIAIRVDMGLAEQ